MRFQINNSNNTGQLPHHADRKLFDILHLISFPLPFGSLRANEYVLC